MNIIKCRTEDLDEICEVETLSFTCPLSRKTLEDMLKNPTACFYAVKEDKIKAFICFERVLDEGQIISVAVHPDSRRKGFASALLERIKEDDISLFTLEVRSDNTPALSLYEKHGFSAVGRRKNYYKDPLCDAILMDLILKEG